MKPRLVRVALESGETEILITNLIDRDAYPEVCFSDLYHHRWPVEEDYNHMKNRIEIDNFTGKSVLAVQQDFHTKVFSKNLAAVLAHASQDQVDLETCDRKHRYQINFTQLLSKVKDSIVLLLDRKIILPMINKLIDITVKSIEPIRPGRKYPREKWVASSRLRTSYKPIR